MPRLYLGLVLHNHQPVGNYGFVIEQVYDDAYAPMLDALERHPGVRVAMHHSGCLFDWLAANRPHYLTRLRALCDRGQVEVMTGGYYEPILPMINDADKVGQIRKLTAFVEDRFGQRPTGLWLTERVWEPGLPAPLAAAGVAWMLVDDAHFRMTGMRGDDLDGYYLTEDQGQRVRLFAGSQRLRYTIPWLNVEDVIADLRALAERAEAAGREAPLIVLGDDGEKFGAWPTTYAHVWENGWIERFFSALEAEAGWLELITPGDYARRFEARGLTYLPTASYAEMMEWAMPADAAAEYRHLTEEATREHRDDVQKYMRGGFWRYFLAKYPEANAMHKRGVRIAEKLAAHDDAPARDALWAAQCNCPYWHGVFGGLYLRHIRRATNRNLVRAERLADEATGANGLRVVEADIDFDGHNEVLVQSAAISLLLHPARGGMISEFDLRRRDHALLDVLARRREAYHEALLSGAVESESGEATNIHSGVRTKEADLAAAVVFDAYRRGGLQEWILPPDASVERFARGDRAPQFEPADAWRYAVLQQPAIDGARITLARESAGWRVTKTVVVPEDDERLGVHYEVTNTSNEHRTAVFVSEWNLSLQQAPERDDRIATIETGGELRDLATAGEIAGVRAFDLRGSAPYALRCETTEPVAVWHYPVESISSSEGGMERVMQGVSLSLVRALDLAPGAATSFDFIWSTVD
jgi:alpha-amylase